MNNHAGYFWGWAVKYRYRGDYTGWLAPGWGRSPTIYHTRKEARKAANDAWALHDANARKIWARPTVVRVKCFYEVCSVNGM